MDNNFEIYLGFCRRKSAELCESVKNNSTSFYEKIQKTFNYKNHLAALLLGEVQSGKTGQIFGIISLLADKKFSVFLLLTTDNVQLYLQTLDRARKALSTFEIFGETDDVTIRNRNRSKPTLILIKKNSRILKKWKTIIQNENLCEARPLIIVDDEADAASLNTLVNKKRTSAINSNLIQLRSLSSSSLYIQVTATPQAILLQTEQSEWKPSIIHYFQPGSGYIGGAKIYSSPRSFIIRTIEENEFPDIRSDSGHVPAGLTNALLSYLIVCAEFKLHGQTNCNFLIHPSVRISDHQTFATVAGEIINTALEALRNETAEMTTKLEAIWKDLQSTQPEISNLADLVPVLINILEESKLNLIILNSIQKLENSLDENFNIIIGGNTLGRGLTIPALQTVYYCRSSKSPQVDTMWQHSRAFGYDRLPGLLRIYIPESQLELFSEINNSNQTLLRQISSNGIDSIEILLTQQLRPTRKNVLDQDAVSTVMGGVNYFDTSPVEVLNEELDQVLCSEKYQSNFVELDSSEFLELFKLYSSQQTSMFWDTRRYLSCLNALIHKRPLQKFILIVRRDRDIAKGTGTLLSPTDRKLSDSFQNKTVLTLYRLNGTTEKGWNGGPFWVPNIRFPDNVIFYTVSEK
jgi:hypothetical protein